MTHTISRLVVLVVAALMLALLVAVSIGAFNDQVASAQKSEYKCNSGAAPDQDPCDPGKSGGEPTEPGSGNSGGDTGGNPNPNPGKGKGKAVQPTSTTQDPATTSEQPASTTEQPTEQPQG